MTYLYNTFKLLTNILHFTFNISDFKQSFKKVINSLTDKQLLFKQKQYQQSAYFYLVDYDELFSHMTIITNKLLKTELQISDPSSFINIFKQNLPSYREHLTTLVKFLSHNRLIKKKNFNCNTTLELTPYSAFKSHKYKEKYITVKQFYGRYRATNYLFQNIIMYFMLQEY